MKLTKVDTVDGKPTSDAQGLALGPQGRGVECPPCTGDCNQGRACPARFEGGEQQPSGAGMALSLASGVVAVLLVSLIAAVTVVQSSKAPGVVQGRVQR